MKTLNIKEEKGIITALLQIEEPEFSKARLSVYLDETERLAIPGITPGLAAIEDIEKAYGSDALKEEALARAIPAAYARFIKEHKIRTVGKPKAADITLTNDGGVLFTVRAPLYPKATLGMYKGITVTVPRSKQEDFRMAVLRKACGDMRAEVPDAMTEARLDAMSAHEKLLVCDDLIYHLLADVVHLLRGAYETAGISRPDAQIRAEALDVMLQAVSKDNGEPSMQFIINSLRQMAERYHKLPENFDEEVKKLAEKRAAERKKMTREEQTEEAFGAYLGSIGADEKSWRAERRKEAEEAALCDLLLEAVAEAETLYADDKAIDALVAEIAKNSGASPEDVTANIGRETIRRQLMRDMACRFITDSAISLPQEK